MLTYGERIIHGMIDIYREWIAQNVPAECTGMCKEFCNKMLAEFPELKLVRGHVYLPKCDEAWPHWWLLSDDEIVDPTISQFPSMILYEPHDENEPEPTGRCLNCGEYCYNGRDCCSDDCFTSFRWSLLNR